MDGSASGSLARETLASAKINLALHVVGRRPDGYHELDSLVVFTREGDRLSMEPAAHDALSLEGPFGPSIPNGGDNIVLRALALARATLGEAGRDLAPQRVRLRKNLPPSSGIGGGSADAAALLRLVACEHPDLGDALQGASVRLGADVPMCLRSRAARVKGVGERIETLRMPQALSLLLANPLIPVSTPAVFSRLARRDNPPLPSLPKTGFADGAELVSYLRACRNDLSEAATELAPVIGEVLRSVEDLGAALARMSGSGATVFGLFHDEVACRDAVRRLSATRSDWWVRATTLVCEDHP